MGPGGVLAKRTGVALAGGGVSALGGGSLSETRLTEGIGFEAIFGRPKVVLARLEPQSIGKGLRRVKCS
jgi:hypothetical protein